MSLSKINEWYSCRSDCPALYDCQIRLLTKTGQKLADFDFRDDLKIERANAWYNVSLVSRITQLAYIYQRH